MKEIIAKYRTAAQKFIDYTIQDEDVIGVVLSGSLIYASVDPHSDIDVYIILNEKCEYRERGNTQIDGIEIEYFKNPPKQIRAYFKKESSSPHTAHMLYHGELMYQT